MARNSEKSEGAFRTIREVADWLGVPTHVLRFWESKFDEISPVKGSGGRRYYRPEDMRLLGGIKVLLHDEGQTIRGVVQRIREDGIEPIMERSPDLDHSEVSTRTRRVIRAGEDVDGGRVVPFERGRGKPVPADEDAVAVPPMPEAEPHPPAGTVASQPDEVVEIAEAPTVAPVPSAPPVDGGVDQPRPGAAPDGVPTEPTEPTPPEEIPVASPGLETPPEATTETPPTVAALRLVREKSTIDPADGRGLKRVVRKLRGLIEEVEDDLMA
ncbi:MAG: MerR family transcriptional regulator [Pseudomonadota bacterium]